MKYFPAEPLAIIGAACRLPGDVSDLASLWNLLENGVDAVSEIPPDRFSLDRYFCDAADLPGHGYTRAAGILNGIKDFDAGFFGMPHKESLDMDPQQRLLLEMAWEAMEQANLPPSSLRGSSTGVYIGASSVDYNVRGLDDPEAISAYSTVGASLAVLANRISYLFDLHGPSQVVETACSSALVALNAACEALWAGKVPLALVGAVNVLLSPFPFIGLSKAHMLSPDGRCKPFDASANGYVRSEGGGVVLIKPLRQAQKDGDAVLAVIAGCGVNSDGRTNGLPLPNAHAQAALLRDVYERFGLDPAKLAYVEAHGTGTAAGDPIEASALGSVLGQSLKGRRPLYTGSVKSNIGHLEPAAGMASLLKAILVLQKGGIPPTLHFKTPSPHIDFKALNLKVPAAMTRLPLGGPETLVGVNSFGFGGTNAHVVLQKAPAPKKIRSAPAAPGAPVPFFLSARSEASLQSLAGKMADGLDAPDDAALYDSARTLITCRDHLRFRAVVTPDAKGSLPDALRALASSGQGQSRLIGEAVAENCPGAFAFSGNGSQWLGMGKALYAADTNFAAAVEAVDACLLPLRGSSVLDALRFPEKYPDQTKHTDLGQPLLFAVQVGLVKALEGKGIRPDAVFGHSVGEVAAAWAAGALSLQDAATVVHHRSRLQHRLKDRGQMAVALIAPDAATELLREYAGLEITAWNAPGSITFAGEPEAVAECVRDWKTRGITAKLLAIPYPFHTKRMEELREEFLEGIAGIRPKKPRVPFFSTAQDPALAWKADAAYWWRNMREPVGFYRASRAALEAGCRVFLEIGPRPVLTGYLQEAAKKGSATVEVLPTLFHAGSETAQFEKAWQSAWKSGWRLDPAPFVTRPFRRRSLPSYPWDRKRLWLENSPECKAILNQERVHPLLGWRMSHLPVFENILGLADFPWIADHRAGTTVLLPAAGFVELFQAAAKALHPAKTGAGAGTRADAKAGEKEGTETWALERLALIRPLTFGKDSAMHIRVLSDEDGSLRLEGRSYPGADSWRLFARARMVPAGSRRPAARPVQPEDLRGERLAGDALYAQAETHHLYYGPAFRSVVETWSAARDASPEILSRLTVPMPETARGMHIPPPLLDGAFQSLLPLLERAREDSGGEAWLPASFGLITPYGDGTPAFSLARLHRVGRRSAHADFLLLDATGKVLVTLTDCLFRRSQWLENDADTPAGYVMRAVPAPRKDAGSPAVAVDPDALQARLAERLAAAFPPKKKGGMSTADLLRVTALKYLHEALEGLWAGKPFSVPEIIASGRVHPSRELWLRRGLTRLAEAGLAACEEGAWSIPRVTNIPAAETLWRTVVGKAPGHLPEAALLLETVAQAVAETAAGTTAGAGTSLAGPARADAETAALLASSYFFHSPDLLPYLEAARACAESLVTAAREDENPKILLSAPHARELISLLLPLCADANVHIEVAERDEAVAKNLGAAYAAVPQLHVRHLDLCKETPHSPGSPPPGFGFDMIVAAFSLHDMADIPAALKGCHERLAPGGTLCLLEHAPNTFTDLTFGSFPGWWTGTTSAPGTAGAADTSGEPVSRLHTASAWTGALRDAGFADPREIASTEAGSPAFLLLAQKAPETPCAPSPALEQGAPPRTRLILARESASPSGALGRALHEEMQKRGHAATLLYFPPEKDAGFDRLSSAAWETFLRKHSEAGAETGTGPLDIVYLLGYDTDENPGDGRLRALLDSGSAEIAALASAWDTVRCETSLWLVAGGAVPVNGDSSPLSLSQGALWGFGRVLMNEMPGLRAVLVDMHGKNPDAALLAREILEPGTGDREIILVPDGTGKGAGGGRYSLRLAAESGAVAERPENPALTINSPGRLQNLYWRDAGLKHCTPGPGKVSIRVKAMGLNFRDVMWSLGLLQEDALDQGFSGPGLGLEGAGIVEAVGPGVRDFAAGDEVIAFLPSRFSACAVTDAALVMRKPAHIGFEEAATLPTAFITALYSLQELARMRPGESILIHGAAGGVGLAAVQLAAHMGLEVFATAGSGKKRDFLRRLGVRHVFSSRSLSFASDVLEATGGQGVDAVLNSLAGEFMAAGIAVLKPFGRFLEIGKRDFFADSSLRLGAFSKNLSFFGIDVDQLFVHNPALSRALIDEMMRLVETGVLSPLPHVRYARTQSQEAFLAMQQSAHIGKLVVRFDETRAGVKRERLAPRPLALRKEGSYLVTGGADGFGLATAMRLAERGAGRVILLSRGGPKNDESRNAIRAMETLGCAVTLAQADVSDYASLTRALDAALGGSAKSGGPGLAGIVHSAAVLDDGMIPDLTPARFRGVLGPKALGAWNLHKATLGENLDFFVLYSSATAAFGNPGSANYVAANCALESLAAQRRGMGLPATVIGWGPIADTGMLRRNEKARQMLTAVLGVGGLSSNAALDRLEYCLAHDIGASHFFGLDWNKRIGLSAASAGRFELLLPRQGGGDTEGARPLDRVRSSPPEEGMALLVELLRAEVAEMLCIPAEQLPPDGSITEAGMDSLMAMELGLAIDQKFELDGYAISLAGDMSTHGLAKQLYPVIMSKSENSDYALSLIESMSHKHGVALGDGLKTKLSSHVGKKGGA